MTGPESTTRRWLLRLTLALAAAAVLQAVAHVLRFAPHPVVWTVLVAGAVLVGWALIDLDVAVRAEWRLPPQEYVVPPGEDAGTASWSRLIEGTLTARSDDETLRDRLGRLADRRLRRRGLERHSDEARELMGPLLSGVLSGPVRRLELDEIETCVERIEQL